MSVVLKDLLLDSKDGEWGNGEPSESSVPMLAIRGTDFERVRAGSLVDVPLRHIPTRIAVRKSLRPLDIVFETAGGSKDRPTGRSILLKSSHFEKATSEITCASFARFLRIDPAKANPEYVFWLLQHLYNSDVLRKYHTQHTGVARYQYTTFAENEALTLPDLTAQIRIASILSAYDDLIENNTRRIAILEEMARRLYEEWFVRFRFPGHEGVRMVESELELVPEGWDVVRLDQVLVLQRGFDLPKQDRTEGPFPIVSATGVSGKHHEFKVKGPGIVTGRSGSLGAVMYVEGDFWPLNTTLWVKQFIVGSPLYAYFVLKGIDLAGFNSGAAVPTLNRNDVHGLPVIRPPAEVLHRFDEVVGPMVTLKERLMDKNTNLRTTRDLLLPKLISGELEVATRPEAEGVAA